MRQLDGLRAVAVTGVLFQHFVGTYSLLPKLMEIGDFGVRLFFVLSGFLITGILLNCRDHVNEPGNSIRQVALRFYARRVLRIFPLFYLVIAAASLLNLGPVRDSLVWHVAYLSNFYLAKQGFWDGCVSHLWSLSVEEQFYLAWPWLVLTLPRVWLLRVTIGAIAVGILSPSIALLVGANMVAATVLPISCFDTLGMGSLLAIFAHSEDLAGRRRRLAMLGRNLGLPLFVMMVALHAFGLAPSIYLVGRDLAVALAGVWLIDNCARGGDSLLDKGLRLPPVIYLGRISYGVYLIHLFIPDLVGLLAYEWGWQLPASPMVRVAMYITITLGLASLSWHFFEKPLNDLKRFVPYRRTVYATSSAEVAAPVTQ